MTRFLLLLSLAGVVSCAPQPGNAPDSVPATVQTDERVGVVKVVGSAPVSVEVVLQADGGGTYRVEGPLREELKRTAGARVAVTGPVEAGALRATGYRILSVDGAPVVMGTVERSTGAYVQLRTAEGEIVYLTGAPDEFRPGQKVWVQGPRSIVVQSYGTLSP